MHWIALPLPWCDEPAAIPGAAMQAAAAGWWALRFTPRVALVDGDTVLLEVSTTERLWGGRAALLAQLHANAPPWGDAPSGDTLGADVAWQAAQAGPKVGGAQAASMPCAALHAAPLATPFTTPFAPRIILPSTSIILAWIATELSEMFESVASKNLILLWEPLKTGLKRENG